MDKSTVQRRSKLKAAVADRRNYGIARESSQGSQFISSTSALIFTEVIQWSAGQ
jgi:hypothetical protein